jgi:hypothetical protein
VASTRLVVAQRGKREHAFPQSHPPGAIFQVTGPRWHPTQWHAHREGPESEPAATRRAGARVRGLVWRPGPRMPCPLIAQSKALGCTGRPAGRAGPAGPALPVALGAGLHSHRGLKARFKIRHGAPEQDTHGLCAASVSIGPNWMSRPGRVRAVYVRLTWHDLASRCGS